MSGWTTNPWRSSSTIGDITDEIGKNTYGANLRTFFKKARDWRLGTRFAESPKIVMIGDSISGGCWAEDFRLWFCEQYSISIYDFEIHWYGGYSIENMLPFIEEVLIFPNPDLVIFNEYESVGSTNEKAFHIENIIKLIKERTTADIAIGTWGMTDTIATAYLDDNSSITDDDQYQWLNWFRDIAVTYNCELIDFNQSIISALDDGKSVSYLFSSGSHLTNEGYTLCHLAEIKKHFRDSNWQAALNIPYPRANKEELVYLAPIVKNELFDNSDKVSITGTWTESAVGLISTSVGDVVEISMKDIIGFEILHGADSYADLTLSYDGGAYAAPSTFSFNSRPLQYITEIVSFTDRGNWDNWRLARPFMKGIITSNDLADTYISSGRYTINVNSIVGGTVTCEMFNPSEVSLGTFTVGQAATFVAGNLSFPQKYNGENNYYIYDGGSHFDVNDVYEFYVKNNWCDSLIAHDSREMFMTKANVRNFYIEEIDEDHYTRYDEKTGICEMKAVPYVSEQRTIVPAIIGNDYRIIYDEIWRDETLIGNLNLLFPTVKLTEKYYHNEYTATNVWSGAQVRGDGGVHRQYRISVKDISGNLTYEDTKKVLGLTRGNYTLRMTVTSGGVNLIGVRALH